MIQSLNDFNASHLVPSQILVVQAFEPLAQLFIVDLIRHVGGELRGFQHRVVDEDWTIEAQRQGQRIAGTRIDADQLAIALEPDEGVERVLLQLVDDDLLDPCVQANEQALDQIVRHRPLRANFFDFEGYGIRFVNSDPDG